MNNRDSAVLLLVTSVQSPLKRQRQRAIPDQGLSAGGYGGVKSHVPH